MEINPLHSVGAGEKLSLNSHVHQPRLLNAPHSVRLPFPTQHGDILIFFCFSVLLGLNNITGRRFTFTSSRMLFCSCPVIPGVGLFEGDFHFFLSPSSDP